MFAILYRIDASYPTIEVLEYASLRCCCVEESAKRFTFDRGIGSVVLLNGTGEILVPPSDS